MHVYIYIYYIYTPGHLGTQKLFFPHRLGLTRLLFRLKARSDEPKYGLLTRVKSKETFGFILAFFWICFVFFWRIVRLSVSLGQLWPKVNQIDMFFPSHVIYVQSNTYWLLTICSVITGKNMRNWKFDYKNMSLRVKPAYDWNIFDVWVPRYMYNIDIWRNFQVHICK